MLTYFFTRLYHAPSGKSVGHNNLPALITSYVGDSYIDIPHIRVDASGIIHCSDAAKHLLYHNPLRLEYRYPVDDNLLFKIIRPMHADGYISVEEFDRTIRYTTPAYINALTKAGVFSNDYISDGNYIIEPLTTYANIIERLDDLPGYSNRQKIIDIMNNNMLNLPDNWVDLLIEHMDEDILTVEYIKSRLSSFLDFPPDFNDRMVLKKMQVSKNE